MLFDDVNNTLLVGIATYFTCHINYSKIYWMWINTSNDLKSYKYSYVCCILYWQQNDTWKHQV